jgi:transposase InsO family protein
MERLAHQYPSDALAEALDVSESGFAAHRRKAQRPRRQRDEQLRPLIVQSFEQSRRTYGSLRVQLDLRESGQRCGKNRIARLMREGGLRPQQKRRFRPCTTDSRHSHKVADNWLAKGPTPDRPGQICQRPPALPCGQRLRPLAISLRSVGRATSPISKPRKAGSTSPSLSMPAHGAVWLTIAGKTCSRP